MLINYLEFSINIVEYKAKKLEYIKIILGQKSVGYALVC